MAGTSPAMTAKAASTAEVGFLDPSIGPDRGGGALENEPSELEHSGMIRDGKRLFCILLDQQDGQSLLLRDLCNVLESLGNRDRHQPGGRLVQQQHLRPRQ